MLPISLVNLLDLKVLVGALESSLFCLKKKKTMEKSRATF